MKTCFFTAGNGTYGVVGEHCSHRGTSLYYGLVEDDGIRCPYHGWKYDACGNCVAQPFENAERVQGENRHPAYPVEKLSGILFAYFVRRRESRSYRSGICCCDKTG